MCLPRTNLIIFKQLYPIIDFKYFQKLATYVIPLGAKIIKLNLNEMVPRAVNIETVFAQNEFLSAMTAILK